MIIDCICSFLIDVAITKSAKKYKSKRRPFNPIVRFSVQVIDKILKASKINSSINADYKIVENGHNKELTLPKFLNQ